MPKEVEDEEELYPSEYENKLVYADVIYHAICNLLCRDLLYTEKEVYYALKENGIDRMLRDRGFWALNLVDRRWSSLQVALHNLWRRPNSKVCKFYGGRRFGEGAGGRPVGVRWMFEEGRIRYD